MKNYFTDFDGVPQAEVAKSDVLGSYIIDLLSEKSGFLKSKGMKQNANYKNAISVNKRKSKRRFRSCRKDLIDGKFLLLQKVKKRIFYCKSSLKFLQRFA